MFKLARIKLTAWYLVIIMTISLFFSAVIYQGATLELQRIERAQRFRRPPPETFAIDPEIMEETRQRVILALSILNVAILGISGIAGYFLAGKTLKPIAEMVEKQNHFISDASHELRTPLTSMKTEIEVGLRNGKIDLKSAKELLTSNLEEVNKMQKLANYLLELNMFQSGNGNLALTQIDLKKVTERAIAKISNLAKTKNIKITKKLQSATVKGNEDSLIELAVILLDNAVKYSPERKEIIVKTQKVGGKALMEFTDFGQGIAKEDLPHIFERFYRAETSRSKIKTDGYGLGLSIAKSIVELHQGEIKVKSRLGKGSTFTVRI
jgi:signal transduction histidine kinase